jgi:hypothetical protein
MLYKIVNSIFLFYEYNLFFKEAHTTKGLEILPWYDFHHQVYWQFVLLLQHLKINLKIIEQKVLIGWNEKLKHWTP